MLAVVKTPRTKIRIKGKISEKLMEVLVSEYGKDVQLTRDRMTNWWMFFRLIGTRTQRRK